MNNKLIIFLLLVSASLYSCKKFVDIPPPKNQLLNHAVFSDSFNANTAVNGLYISMQQGEMSIGSGGLTLYTGLTGDELLSNTGSLEENSFYQNEILTTSNVNQSNFWTTAYNVIYNANAIVEGLEAATQLSSSLRNKLTGESKFVRAFMYFNLVNLYGKVPLVTSTDYNKNKIMPTTSVDSVYSQIINDLESASAMLPTTDIVAGKVRPNRFAALALLAKAYLFTKDWAKSETAATQVINSGSVSLSNDLNDIFLASSNEAIWKMVSVIEGLENWEGYYFLPFDPSMLPYYTISDELVSSFESNDKRKVNWLKSNNVNGQDYYYPFKYKFGYDGMVPPLEHTVVLRLAEQYLIRAEARAQQNKLVLAIDDINMIRDRAGLIDIPNSLNQAQVLSAVEQERRVELFCEWGNRWFDLKRWMMADQILSGVKPAWESTDALFPIPQLEINANHFLIQNEGY